MKEIIEALYPMNRCLLGSGYDSALEFIKHLVKIDVIEIPSGTEIGTWTVPKEWVIREAWVKDINGNKIIDWAKDPMSLMINSCPIRKKMSLSELGKHLHVSDEMTKAIPYTFSLYEENWGFNAKKEEIMVVNTDTMAGVKLENGQEFIPKFKLNLPEGEYEVFIDSEFVDSKMKIGVHTIKGETDKEILLFAHLDHPYQANDNLSAVACLLELTKTLKSKHTIKIIFCPETIGSVAYALTQDISKVQFVLAVDICGNDNEHTLQLSLKPSRANDAFHLSLRSFQESYKLGKFRNIIGSDEYPFNDPLIDIPGIMLTRYPYKEYHTSEDNPEHINYEKIQRTCEVVSKAIEIYDNDFIPVKKFKGPLMRSKYGVQTGNPQMNLAWDYLFYNIDGEKSLAQLCVGYGIHWEVAYELFKKLQNDKHIGVANSQGKVKKTTRKKHKAV